MKTQYILKLADSIRSKVTEHPEQIYWNRGLQKMDDNINPISTFFMFKGTPPKTIEEMDIEALESNAYPIEITDFDDLTMAQFKEVLAHAAERELEAYDIYADYHKLFENESDSFYEERGKLIQLIDITA